MRHGEEAFVVKQPVSDPTVTVYIVTQETAIPIEIPVSEPAEKKKVGA